MNTVNAILKKPTSFALILALILSLVAPLAAAPLAFAQADDAETLIVEGGGEDDLADLSADEIEAAADEPPVAEPAAAQTDTEQEKVQTGNLPSTFSSKDVCVANVSKKSLSEAKKYAELRATKRTAKLKQYNVRVDNQRKAVNKAYKDNVKRYTINKDVKVKKVVHTKAVKTELANSAKQIKTKREAAKAAKDVPTVAKEACGIIYDIRVYTYLEAKIKHQKVVDTYYRQNALLKAQYDSLVANAKSAKLSPEQSAKVAGMTDPAATRANAIDPLQQKLETINVTFLNTEIANTKKNTSTIFADNLNPLYAAAKASTTNDVKTATAGRSAIKAATAAASKPKITLTTAQINEVCKKQTEASLKGSNGKILSDLTKACNLGIKAGFKKQSTAKEFCETGGKKWTAGKSPKKTAACEYGYAQGKALRQR